MSYFQPQREAEQNKQGRILRVMRVPVLILLFLLCLRFVHRGLGVVFASATPEKSGQVANAANPSKLDGMRMATLAAGSQQTSGAPLDPAGKGQPDMVSGVAPAAYSSAGAAMIAGNPAPATARGVSEPFASAPNEGHQDEPRIVFFQALGERTCGIRDAVVNSIRKSLAKAPPEDTGPPLHDPSAKPATDVPVDQHSNNDEVTAIQDPTAAVELPQTRDRPASRAPRSLLLQNPLQTGGAVRFLIDNQECALQPGQSQSLPAGRRYRISFDRGADFGDALYGVSEGVYQFRITPHGWELMRRDGR